MTEQVFEETIENAVNTFGNWAWRYEIIFGVICSVVLIVIGLRLLKKEKKNAGNVCMGIGLLIFILDVIKALFGLLS